MLNLEPRVEFGGTILFNENDEINEVLFFIKGIVDCGFMVNRQENYCLRLNRDIIIGAYNICTNKRTKFLYKAKKDCSGYFIRRSNWKSIMDDPELKMVTDNFERSVTKYYQEKILRRMTYEKQRSISKWKKRADYQAIISLKEVKPEGWHKDVAIDVGADGPLDFKEEVQILSKKVGTCQDLNTNILGSFDELKVKFAELESKYEESEKELKMLMS